jgi:hypothetical protein
VTPKRRDPEAPRDPEARSAPRNQLKQVFDALRELMTPPDPPKRPIGFVTPEDSKTGGKGKAQK